MIDERRQFIRQLVKEIQEVEDGKRSLDERRSALAKGPRTNSAILQANISLC
jgi:hypothetical protein